MEMSYASIYHDESAALDYYENVVFPEHDVEYITNNVYYSERSYGIDKSIYEPGRCICSSVIVPMLCLDRECNNYRACVECSVDCRNPNCRNQVFLVLIYCILC